MCVSAAPKPIKSCRTPLFFYTCEPENMKPSKRKTFASLKNTPPEITADDSRAISDPKPNIWETKKPNLKMETCQVNV